MLVSAYESLITCLIWHHYSQFHCALRCSCYILFHSFFIASIMFSIFQLHNLPRWCLNLQKFVYTGPVRWDRFSWIYIFKYSIQFCFTISTALRKEKATFQNLFDRTAVGTLLIFVKTSQLVNRFYHTNIILLWFWICMYYTPLSA